jgi:chemotaxis protein methyltransferase CheR
MDTLGLNTELPSLNERDFNIISHLMADISGIQMAAHKRALASGRLMKRLRALQIDNFPDYVLLLQNPQQQEERRIAVDLLTTNETFFFREKPHFDLLLKLLKQHPRRPLRLWSAACSSGEEVYSLAMTLQEGLETKTHWEIVGSDLCRQALDKAKKAIYPLQRTENMPPEWLNRYCLKGIDSMDGLFRIRTELCQHTHFECLNLNEPIPENLGKFDIIFLRNMLIYFDQETKAQILQRIVGQLKSGGLLFVGHSEGLHGISLPVTPYAAAVYRKNV